MTPPSDLRTAIVRRLRNAWHNIVIHPLAGVCWLFGWAAAGDWLHGGE